MLSAEFKNIYMKIIIIGIRFARNDVKSKGYFFISLYLFLSHISYMLLKNVLFVSLYLIFLMFCF